MIIGVILSILSILTSDTTIPKAIISDIIGLYFTLCVYSLYIKLKEGEFAGNRVQSQPYEL
jgi:hypothetical protein